MISLGSHLSTRFGRNQSHLSQFSAAFRWLSSSSSANNEGGNDEAKSSGNVEWIPPNRPLHGDRDHSQLFRSQQELDRAEEALFTENEGDSEAETLRRLEEALALEERLEKDRLKDIDNRQQDPSNVDWLETRRKALGEKGDSESVVEVKHHKLLMENELSSLLESFGGRDITVLPDDEEYPRMGGATAMILCTASNQFYVHSIAKNLVDHLRERELQDVGVMGAKMGKGFLQANNRTNWNVLDCQNYIVHIFDDDTRQALNLEALWSGRVCTVYCVACETIHHFLILTLYLLPTRILFGDSIQPMKMQ